jgi:hypothetical protein
MRYDVTAPKWNGWPGPAISFREVLDRDRLCKTLTKLYGIKLEDFERLIELQNRKCKACGDPFTRTNGPQVDHCHSLGHVRGLWCQVTLLDSQAHQVASV